MGGRGEGEVVVERKDGVLVGEKEITLAKKGEVTENEEELQAEEGEENRELTKVKDWWKRN